MMITTLTRLMTLTLSSSALASTTGVIDFDANSFMRTSNDRATTYNTVTLAPDFKSNGKVIEAEASLKVIAFTNNLSSVTGEAPNLYLASSRELDSQHQVTLGRRKFEWSELDEQWKLGVWTPRFTWIPYRPENIGLTGAFYTYETNHFRVMAFGSPISIPEHGSTMASNPSAGTISYYSPWQKPLPTTLNAFQSSTPIFYSVNMPDIGGILMRPEAALKVSYGDVNGYWASANVGYLPVHQLDLAVQATLTASNVMANIQPLFPMQQVATLESGFRGNGWSLWGSLSGQNPQRNTPSVDYMVAPMNPAFISALGGSIKGPADFTLSGSVLNINESTSTPYVAVSGTTVNIPLDSRFIYKKAVQVSAQWGEIYSRLLYRLSFVNDFQNQSNWISADVQFSPWAQMRGRDSLPLVFGLGADFFNSNSGIGTIGKYLGDDQVRGRISYVF